MQEPIRKTDHSNNSSTPKNLIVNTNKYLLKNIASEVTKLAPKNDGNLAKDNNIIS